MERFLILLRCEFKVWVKDPITFLGGFIAPTVMLVAFGLLFSGELSFPIAVINDDRGSAGQMLLNSFDEVLSPFGQPYFRVTETDREAAWRAYEQQRVEAIWVILPDFTDRLFQGDHPKIEMHFSNYTDDRAKNHRLYSAEILWHFYEEMGFPKPPLQISEAYPRPVMVDWLSVIGVGLVLLSITLGSMFNIFALTFKEKTNQVTLEFGLAPHSMATILLPKLVLAAVVGLMTGMGVLVLLCVWTGIWPDSTLWLALFLAMMVAVFWMGMAMVFSLRTRHFMAGAIGIILASIVVFFVGGGLSSVRYYPWGIRFFAWLFPNTLAIDLIRDILLFQDIPGNWLGTALIVTLFAAIGLWVGIGVAGKQLRRLG